MPQRPKSKHFTDAPRLMKNCEYANYFGVSSKVVGQQKYNGRFVTVNMAGVKFIDIDATFERDNLTEKSA